MAFLTANKKVNERKFPSTLITLIKVYECFITKNRRKAGKIDIY